MLVNKIKDLASDALAVLSNFEAKGNFEAKITLSDLSEKELTWWENNIMTATKSLKKLPIDATIYTDASLDDRGAVCEKSETGGMWTK